MKEPKDASYQSEIIMKALPHQQNIGFDLGNIEIKERGLKSVQYKKFTIAGKDWGAEYILFIDHEDQIFYLVKPSVKTLGKKPHHRNDQRNVSLGKVMAHAFFKTSSNDKIRLKLLELIDPKFKDIIEDLKSAEFCIFEKNINEST